MKHTCSNPHHKPATCYAHGCRCDNCRKAARTVEKRARWRRQTGQPSLYVDAAPARAKLATMWATLTTSEIEARVGVNRAGLYRIRDGRVVRIRTETAAKIAAATLGPAPTPVGASRRIQGLACLGWSAAAIAREADLDQDSVLRLRRGDHRRTERRTLAAIAAACEQLWQRTPDSRGSSAANARNVAAREGWAPLLAWDDDGPHGIDNPAATPYRCARTDTRPHGATRENVAELSAQGLTDEGIAHRLGITVNAVQTARRRAAA